VSAERAGARVAVAAKGSLQSCNSAKAQGGIQAAFGDDDSPEQHAEDVWRSSHETADMGLVEILTTEAPGAIHWLEELGVAFTRENGGYRIAKCGGASRKRLLQVGDRTGHAITKGLREAWESGSGTTFERAGLRDLNRGANSWRATCGEHVLDATTVVLAAGGRCYAEAEARGELSTNHPGATGEVTKMALELGAESRDLDALQYHPNGGAWPANMQGYSIPETTRAYGAVLLNAEGEEFTDSLGPRDAVSQAIFDEVEAGRGVETPDGPARRLARHDAHRGGGRERLPAVHAPPLPCRRNRSPRREDFHLPRPPLPERRPRDRHERRDDARGRLRVRRDRRRHAWAQPHDGQQPPRVCRLRPPRRQGRRRESERMSIETITDPAAGRRGCRGAPLRLVAEGHPAGPARRARRGALP
jgi:succinate dehydrogenase / fumarate reductase flavoprotein subunit/L-aspartate oxidase